MNPFRLGDVAANPPAPQVIFNRETPLISPRLLTHVAPFTALALVLACSGEGKEKENESTGEKPGSTSSTIVAADGGEIALGKAKLTIPANALTADTEITVVSTQPSSSLPDSSTVRGLTYDYGPDGTTFSSPVTLELPLAGTPGTNQRAVISWLNTDTNAWVDLDSSVDENLVAGETDHFTLFAVRIIDVPPYTCEFTACGGDVLGTWVLLDDCEDDDPYTWWGAEGCPSGTASASRTSSMTMTFNDNDTVEQTLESESVETYTIPAECFQNLFQATPQSCSDLDDSFVQDGYSSTSVCTGNPAVSCTCVDTYTENDNEILSYSTSENSITVDGDTGDYCVESDGQIIKYLPPGDSNPIVMGKE